eukprot:2642859-Pyramimonas_sp.AAC.1
MYESNTDGQMDNGDVAFRLSRGRGGRHLLRHFGGVVLHHGPVRGERRQLGADHGGGRRRRPRDEPVVGVQHTLADVRQVGPHGGADQHHH